MQKNHGDGFDADCRKYALEARDDEPAAVDIEKRPRLFPKVGILEKPLLPVAPAPRAAPTLSEIPPKLMLMAIFEGSQRFRIDDRNFVLQTGSGAEPVRALMINLTRPSILGHFGSSPGMRKIQISCPPDWIDGLYLEETEGSPPLHDFLSRHLSHFAWTPSRQFVWAARELLEPAVSRPELCRLNRHARALDMLRFAFDALLAERSADDPLPSLSAARQGRRVRDFIIANLSENLTIEHIARETGASASTVQRAFKAHFGITVQAFIRQRKLELAKTALCREGITIAEAAYIAGYSNASNFTCAFKRIYGFPPGRTARMNS
jgi:AraC-like DNA-binding protein